MKQQYLLGKEVASEMAAIMKAQSRSVIAKPFEKTAAKKEDDKEATAKEKAKEKAKKEKEKAKKEKDKKKAKKSAAETLRKSVSGLAKISEVLDNLGLVRGSLATLGALDCLVKEAIAKNAHHIPDGEREGALDAGETATPATAPEPAKDESDAEDEPKDDDENEKLAAYDSLLLKLGSK